MAANEIMSEKIERIIHQENLSALTKTCVENEEKLETEYSKKSKECERLKSSLEDACEKVITLHSLYNDLVQNYDLLLENTPSMESFLNFLNHELESTDQLDDTLSEYNRTKSDRDKFTEEFLIDSQWEDLIDGYETPFQDNFGKKSLDCDSGEKEKIVLKLKKKKEQCKRLKTELETANEELTKINKSLCDSGEKEKIVLKLKKKKGQCKRLKTELQTTNEELTKTNELLGEKEKIELKLKKKKEQCRRLKTKLQTANEELTKTNELLCDSGEKERIELKLEKKKEQCRRLITELGTAQEELTKTNELLCKDSRAKKCLKSELKKKTEQCESLKTELKTAKEELTKTNELLNAEKMLRSKVDIERNSLTCIAKKLRLLLIVFLKYKHCLSPDDNIVVLDALNDGELMTELNTMEEYESGTNCVSPLKNMVNDEMAHKISDLSAVSSFSIENYDNSNQERSLSSINELISSQSPSFRKADSEPIIEQAPCSEPFPMITYIKEHQRKRTSSRSSVQSREYVQLTSVVATEISLSQTETCAQRTSISNTDESEGKATLLKDSLPELRSPTVINHSSLGKEDPSINKPVSSHSLLFPILSIKKHPIFTCDSCGESFVKETCLKIHQRKHTNSQSSVKNKEENVQFTSKSEEKATSLNGSSPKKPQVRSASVSNNSSPSKKDSSVAPQCDICNKSFSNIVYLRRHKRRVHDGVKPHKCSDCNKTFCAKSELRIHQARHSSQNPSYCSICYLSFKSNFDRKIHYRTEHKGMKSHKCGECNKTFRTKSNLRDHESTHTSERAFQCSICNKSFKSNPSRRMHEKIVHEGYGVYCAYCNKKYTKKQLLIHHIRVNHLPELHEKQAHKEGYGVYCAYCNKKYTKKHHLIHHIRMNHLPELHEKQAHTEGGYYFCTYCEKIFRRKDLLVAHIKRLHSVALCV